MNRREVFDFAATVGMVTAGAATVAAVPSPSHDHAAMSRRHGALVESATECINAGDVCLDHCLMMLEQGDKAMAACARSVRDMLAACGALRQLASTGSPRLPVLAKAVATICSDCKDECAKHKTHDVCRACGEACSRCATECDKVAA
jgi:Cys-rich four helix bundle protein (predicted Tat secretion target)